MQEICCKKNLWMFDLQEEIATPSVVAWSQIVTQQRKTAPMYNLRQELPQT